METLKNVSFCISKANSGTETMEKTKIELELTFMVLCTNFDLFKWTNKLLDRNKKWDVLMYRHGLKHNGPTNSRGNIKINKTTRNDFL